MKVLIVGANGKIGTILSERLSQEENFEPLAMIRKEEQKEKFDQLGISTIQGDLSDSVEELEKVVKKSDAVVFTAGSGGGTGAEKTLEIDLGGAVKTALAAEKANVKRFVLVSAAGADDRSFWSKSGIKPYYVAKHFADEALKNSALDYTILRPTRLTDDSGKGKIKVGKSPADLNNEIAREDVANTILEVLKNEKSSKHKVIEFSQGETAIAEAI